jgi:predicted ATPase
LYGVEDASEAARVEELLALSTENGFAFVKTMGTIHRGRCLAMEGREAEGIAQMTEGLAAFRSTGTVSFLPRFLTLIVEVYGRARQPLVGLEHLTEAIDIIERTEGREYEAELYRVRGQLLLALGDRAAAEENYCTALAVARRQKRQAVGTPCRHCLARLWRDQGKHAEARDLLAPVYRWFTEGFDTPVLRGAKALLDELA